MSAQAPQQRVGSPLSSVVALPIASHPPRKSYAGRFSGPRTIHLGAAIRLGSGRWGAVRRRGRALAIRKSGVSNLLDEGSTAARALSRSVVINRGAFARGPCERTRLNLLGTRRVVAMFRIASKINIATCRHCRHPDRRCNLTGRHRTGVSIQALCPVIVTDPTDGSSLPRRPTGRSAKARRSTPGLAILGRLELEQLGILASLVDQHLVGAGLDDLAL